MACEESSHISETGCERSGCQDLHSCTCIVTLKPRPHERFFARAGDAIFSNFVASPAREGGYTSDKF